MGLIKAAVGAAGGVMADQWKEFFYCESMPKEVLVTKGVKRTSGRSSNTRGSDNIITSGSGIAVADGQCMMIVEQGRVVELCDAGKDQRVYYFNTKELIDNKFGTPNPIPFRVVDNKIGLDVDVSVRCSGVYSYRIADPLLFYTNVCGNVEQEYTRDELDSQLKHEFISALQPAFGKLSDLGLRPNQIVAHNTELEDAMNTALSAKWGELRGLTVVSIALGSVTLPDEDAEMIKQAQRTAMMRDPTMAAATLVGAQSDAMKTAAGNSAGAMNGFMGVNMAMNAGGMNAQALYGMGQQQAAQAADSWKCACGTVVNGNFCPNCGAKKPDNDDWTCSCGKVNKGNFCANCGAKKPEGLPKYRCDKCGWEPEDPAHPPKFCPQCGDPFDENDRA